MNDPLESMMDYAERIYIRMEAELVIKACLENDEIQAFNQLVEDLVLAGKPSYGIMREILEEIRSVRAALSEEGIVIRRDLTQALCELGIVEPAKFELEFPEMVRKLCKNELDTHIKQLSTGLDIESGEILSEICIEASEQMRILAKRMTILGTLESLLRDWYQGMAYHIMHDRISLTREFETDQLH